MVQEKLTRTEDDGITPIHRYALCRHLTWLKYCIVTASVARQFAKLIDILDFADVLEANTVINQCSEAEAKAELLHHFRIGDIVAQSRKKQMHAGRNVARHMGWKHYITPPKAQKAHAIAI